MGNYTSMAIAGDWKATQHYRHLRAIHVVEENKLGVLYLRNAGWSIDMINFFPTWLEAVESYDSEVNHAVEVR